MRTVSLNKSTEFKIMYVHSVRMERKKLEHENRRIQEKRRKKKHT